MVHFSSDFLKEYVCDLWFDPMDIAVEYDRHEVIIKISIHDTRMKKTVKYFPVDNERRHELIRLIYEEKLSIRQAAIQINISYPTAKAINRIYKQEDRVDKKKVRERRSTSAKYSGFTESVFSQND